MSNKDGIAAIHGSVCLETRELRSSVFFDFALSSVRIKVVFLKLLAGFSGVKVNEELARYSLATGREEPASNSSPGNTS